MLRLLKRFGWLGLVAGTLSPASVMGFSLLGPFNEAWQVFDLGFNVGVRGDIGAPKNLGEEYRRNIPILYYSYDASFLDYFGSNGVHAIDQAFNIMNELKPVSQYSPDLSEVPLEAKRLNAAAETLRLVDLKSRMLSILVEQMGLADPIRYMYNIHDRVVGANCPIGNLYLVTVRNFGMVPTSLDEMLYSSYVNGIQYGYYIQEYCGNPPAGEPTAEAVEIPLELESRANLFSPVAAGDFNGLSAGEFYTGLTRDDVAGLRHLLSSSNVNWEDSPPGTTVFSTNTTSVQLVGTSNLTLLAAQALTNTAAALQALYPNLVITSTSNYFANVWVTNTFAYFTNSVYDPVGTLPRLAFATNRFLTVQTFYYHTFGNLLVLRFDPAIGWTTEPVYDLNSLIGRTFYQVQTYSVTNSPWAPVGTVSLTTNTTTRTYSTNTVAGEFIILPTNSCSVALIQPQLTNVTILTNFLVIATNTVPDTNGIGATNVSGQSFIQVRLDYVTNHFFVAYAVECLTNLPGLRRGVEKITFVRRDFDSLLGRFFYPITNYFQITMVTNSANRVQTYERIVTAPDFLITAEDMVPGPAAQPIYFIARRSINFSATNATGGAALAGPGVINSPSVITFNKSGPIFVNQVTNGLWSLDQLFSVRRVMWASFDDSTNAPVVYPNGASLQALENMLLLRVVANFGPANVGVPFGYQLDGGGGQRPYKFYLAPGSPVLPPGLQLATDGSGLISGTPVEAGTYTFVVQIVDSNQIYSNWEVTLTVSP